MKNTLTKKDAENCWIALSYIRNGTQDLVSRADGKLHPSFLKVSKDRIKRYAATIKKLEKLI